jgi:hypothetical protein
VNTLFVGVSIFSARCPSGRNSQFYTFTVAIEATTRSEIQSKERKNRILLGSTTRKIQKANKKNNGFYATN